MGNVVYDDDVTPFEVEGDTFNLKTKMSYGDKQTLVNASLAVASKIQNGTLPVDAGTPTLFLLNIKSWSLKGRDGQGLEVNAVTINKFLSPECAEALKAEIAALQNEAEGAEAVPGSRAEQK